MCIFLKLKIRIFYENSEINLILFQLILLICSYCNKLFSFQMLLLFVLLFYLFLPLYIILLLFYFIIILYNIFFIFYFLFFLNLFYSIEIIIFYHSKYSYSLSKWIDSYIYCYQKVIITPILN